MRTEQGADHTLSKKFSFPTYPGLLRVLWVICQLYADAAHTSSALKWLQLYLYYTKQNCVVILSDKIFLFTEIYQHRHQGSHLKSTKVNKKHSSMDMNMNMSGKKSMISIEVT